MSLKQLDVQFKTMYQKKPTGVDFFYVPVSPDRGIGIYQIVSHCSWGDMRVQPIRQICKWRTVEIPNANFHFPYVLSNTLNMLHGKM